jgi:diketogulonate reductase-like aldo/keto reductase
MMPTLDLRPGKPVPVLGQGTWGMGERAGARQEEIAALRLGIDLGMTLIDTAEMYGEGAAEELVAEAVGPRRAEVFLVSKFYPHHADRKALGEACERSLRRLRTERIDLYLLHWRGPTPLAETLDGLEKLRQAGNIGEYGVSNFDVKDMEEAAPLRGGDGIATDQVLYNLSRRGIEWDLLPWCRERSIAVMAYSPIEQARILKNAALRSVAKRHSATPAQVALAWVLRQPGVLTVPKAATREHVRENRGALDVQLAEQDLAELDRAFPPPAKKRALEML